MNDRERGLFQHPEDDEGPRRPDLIRGVPLHTVARTISVTAEILAEKINVKAHGGIVVIQELVAAEPEKGLRCWQFSFGNSNDPYVMECAEECTVGVSNFLHEDPQDKISSVQFDLDPGTICDPHKCKLALSAQGFEDPRGNEALVVAIARYFQWFDKNLEIQISQISDNNLTQDLISLKFFS